jgi:HPt (histidine-containing phosphotransfer) domain-containing protein
VGLHLIPTIFNFFKKRSLHLKENLPIDWEKLKENFLNIALGKVNQMKKALSEGNLNLVQTYAHQLKGSGASYGFSEITEIAGQIEEKCASNLCNEVSELVQKLCDLIEKFKSNSR